MAMPLHTPLRVPTYTTDDLRRFPRDGQRYELLDGFLLVTPAPGGSHQVVLSRLMAALLAYLPAGAPALVTSPGEIEIKPKVLLDPDILVFPAPRSIRTSWTRVRGWWLVVEVSGRGSRIYDREFKRDAYMALGVREVWLADLHDEEVLVSRVGEFRHVPHRDAVSWHPPEMPAPLSVDLRAIFAGLG